MKIKIGQFHEIADILLQVHAYKKVILMASNGRKGWGMFLSSNFRETLPK